MENNEDKEQEQSESGAGSFEVEDEFHRHDDDATKSQKTTDEVSQVNSVENHIETDEKKEEVKNEEEVKAESEEQPLELTKKHETHNQPYDDGFNNIVSNDEPVQEVEVKTEEREDEALNTCPVQTEATVNVENLDMPSDTSGHAVGVIQPVPGHLAHAEPQPVHVTGLEESVMTSEENGVTAAVYGNTNGVSNGMYPDDGSYIVTNIEYIGSADNLGDDKIEYVTLAGDITTEEGEESRVIGVLRDGTLDYNNVPYYTIRAPEDPIQAALNTAEVDKVDLMQFQVLNPGEIVYERDIGPPPPLFEDPSLIKEQYDRESPMYTTLESAGSTAASYSSLQLAPPSPNKYYGQSSNVPPYSPPYQYSGYARPPGYPPADNLSHLYPGSGYSSQFSYEQLGSIYDANATGMGKGVSNYGGIFVPSAASTALPTYSMHPMEVATSSTEHSSGPGPVVTSASMSSLSRYGSEPDPFKHATDVSQCVTCGAQITASSRKSGSQLCHSCANYSKMNGIRPSTGGSNTSSVRSPPAKSKSGNRRTGMICANCQTNTTTLWRRNAQGEPVCNACGLYFKLHGINRIKKTDDIRSRKRKPKNNTTPKEPRKPQKQKHAYNATLARTKTEPVKLEVVLPNSGTVQVSTISSQPTDTHTPEHMVINTMKHGMDVMNRLKTSDIVAPTSYDDTSVYNIDRQSAIMSLDPMLSRAQTLLSSPGPDTNYNSYQSLYPSSYPAHVPRAPMLHSSSSPMLSQTAAPANSPMVAAYSTRSSPGIAEPESMQM